MFLLVGFLPFQYSVISQSYFSLISIHPILHNSFWIPILVVWMLQLLKAKLGSCWAPYNLIIKAKLGSRCCGLNQLHWCGVSCLVLLNKLFHCFTWQDLHKDRKRFKDTTKSIYNEFVSMTLFNMYIKSICLIDWLMNWFTKFDSKVE